MTSSPRKVGRAAFLSVMSRGKPHVYCRAGVWWAYIPPMGFRELPKTVRLCGSSISDHRRAAGWMT